jgi:hypothetical protein
MARAVERPPAPVVGRPGMPPPDVRQWLIDNDLLWDDGVGLSSEAYARQVIGRRGGDRNGVAGTRRRPCITRGMPSTAADSPNMRV